MVSPSINLRTSLLKPPPLNHKKSPTLRALAAVRDPRIRLQMPLHRLPPRDPPVQPRKLGPNLLHRAPRTPGHVIPLLLFLIRLMRREQRVQPSTQNSTLLLPLLRSLSRHTTPPLLNTPHHGTRQAEALDRSISSETGHALGVLAFREEVAAGAGRGVLLSGQAVAQRILLSVHAAVGAAGAAAGGTVADEEVRAGVVEQAVAGTVEGD